MSSGGALKPLSLKAGASIKEKKIIQVEKLNILKYKLLTFFAVKLDENIWNLIR